MAIESVSEATFEEAVTREKKTVLVDFWAPWCRPCTLLAPVLEQVSCRHEGRLKVVKVNIDENQALAVAFGIRTIPTMVVFRGGERAGVISGAMPAAQLEYELRKLVPDLA
ncbi:thioredoxin [Stenotrophomonas beteli]|uniref:thioredoxin n=1 Tax=Stenotrophomonas beteli TaxID=3384461 RepID=UPI0009B3FF89|nr:thioredoxin [Stenotrophomonas maltophilia]